MNVLIVEDDESVARFLEQAMVEAKHNPVVVGDGVTALDIARTEEEFDVILLDLMLPRMSGFEVCRRLRSSGIMTPILIITARDSLEDIVEGLDSGADDYVVKPFQVAELLARTRALLRRGESSPAVLTVCDLTLSPTTRRATRGGQAIKLSATECTLLEYLMRNAGRVMERSMILQHVWQCDFEGNENVLEVYISYLRGKIDKGHEAQLIHTVRGVGYRMAADVV
ncbi:MAG: response regulator transcription factor [Armatimonadota bacterium]|nr:response regulator transcription factor [Armatimonadota bacterium]